MSKNRSTEDIFKPLRKAKIFKVQDFKVQNSKEQILLKKLTSQLAKITRTQQANMKLIFATSETFAGESELKRTQPVLE